MSCSTVLRTFLVLIAFVSITAFAGDEPAEQWHPYEANAKRDADGERIWNMNYYLKGTRFQIRDTLNLEVVRLQQKEKESQAGVADAEHDIKNDSAVFVASHKKAPVYAKVVADEADAKIELDKAHAEHDTGAAMDAGSRYNHDRAAIAKMDREIVVSMDRDDNIIQDKTRLAKEQADLAGFQEGLNKAKNWREKLRDAARNSFVIAWPLTKGSKGTLGDITPSEVTNDGIIVAKFDAAETTETKDAGEGIVTVHSIVHPVTMLISGADTSKFVVGQAVRFDRTIEVVKTDSDPDLGVYCIVRVKHCDADDLLEAVASDEVSKKP